MHVMLKVNVFVRQRSQTAVRVAPELNVKQRDVHVFRGTSVCDAVIRWEERLLWWEHATSIFLRHRGPLQVECSDGALVRRFVLRGQTFDL